MSTPPPLPPNIPYASPAPVLPYATATFQQDTAAWREGNVLVVRKGFGIPGGCVKCNGMDNLTAYRKTYSWHEPAIYFSILAGILIYVILAMVLRKSVTLDLHLCAAHRAKRNKSILIGWLIAVAGVLSLVYGCVALGASGDDPIAPWAFLASVILIIVGAVVGSLGAKMLSPKKIDGQFAWLTGAGPEYLANLNSR